MASPERSCDLGTYDVQRCGRSSPEQDSSEMFGMSISKDWRKMQRNLGQNAFADFRPSFSRENGRNKCHTKKPPHIRTSNSTRPKPKFCHCNILGVANGGTNTNVICLQSKKSHCDFLRFSFLGARACVQALCFHKKRRLALAWLSPLSSRLSGDLQGHSHWTYPSRPDPPPNTFAQT